MLDGRDAELPRQVLEGAAGSDAPWTLETTLKYGKGVENGVLKAVGVVPKPLQKPHPPAFLPFASSEGSIRWAAREGMTAILPPIHEAYEAPLFDLYAEVSGKPRGQGTGLLRDVIIAETDVEAMALWEDSGRFSGRAWFEPFGFRRGLMDPVTKKFASAQQSIDLGYGLVGTVDTVTRALEANVKRLLYLQCADSARQADEIDRGVVDKGVAEAWMTRCERAPHHGPSRRSWLVVSALAAKG